MQEITRKKPSIRSILRTMKVDETRRWPIESRGSTKSQIQDCQIETGKRFRVKTAKNKCSFTVTRIE